MNPIHALLAAGQSVWLDYIRRDMLRDGRLAKMVGEQGLRGMTSNPSIFEKAIASADYDDIVAALAGRHRDTKRIYEGVAVADIQAAADLLHEVYAQSGGRDGFVSLEVSPLLAHDTAGTLAEARRLWREVDRPNLMIKVPGTAQGIPAMAELIAEGINVNVTLLFSRSAYEAVAEAYVGALEKRAARRADVQRVASVASFFVSRIDSAVDAELEALVQKRPECAEKARSLQGRIAIANAKVAYAGYRARAESQRWQALVAQGAQPQRLLWASTSTKNPAYRDVVYVEELIGRDTVNTLPPATFDAFLHHGRVRESLSEDIEGAKRDLECLEQLGISLDRITARLLDEGVASFSDAFAKMLAAIEKRAAVVS